MISLYVDILFQVSIFTPCAIGHVMRAKGYPKKHQNAARCLHYSLTSYFGLFAGNKIWSTCSEPIFTVCVS